MLIENRDKVASIIEQISPLIIGQHLPGFSCGCGAIHSGPATAVAVHPAGDSYPGQEVYWYLWSVKMSYHPENPFSGGWSIGISEFIPSEELKVLFISHFGENPDPIDPYELDIGGGKRVKQGLPPAVKIYENDIQIRFSFDWGNHQKAAKRLYTIYEKSPHRILKETSVFEQIVAELEKLTEVRVYRGGPDPIYPFEVKWLLEYKEALHQAKAGAHIFFQNLLSSSDTVPSMDIVFMKANLVE